MFTQPVLIKNPFYNSMQRIQVLCRGMIRSFQDKIGEARARQMQADLRFFFLFVERRDSRLTMIPSLKLTARPWKWMVGRCISFWGPAYFQGRAVSFREGCCFFFEIRVSKQTPWNGYNVICNEYDGLETAWKKNSDWLKHTDAGACCHEQFKGFLLGGLVLGKTNRHLPMCQNPITVGK